MILVIVESATKAKKIQGYIGKDYRVIASFGHIVDLPKNTLGINTADWTCEYTPTKPDIITKLKQAIKQCDTVYLASDPDREGHAIAYHISQLVPRSKRSYRIVFNEITRDAILNAIQNKSEVDLDMFYSQECRRILDRLCGYGLSPLLWNRFNQNNLSCGRVQSCVLAMCVQRLDAILNHQASLRYDIKGSFMYGKRAFKDCTNTSFTDQDQALQHLRSIQWEGFKIYHATKDTNKNPHPPYITTSIQIDAHSSLKISAKECMNLLQKLYENGFITYHRTDSLSISDRFKQAIKQHIKTAYGDKYVCLRNYKTSDKNAQEAHECIRITDLEKREPSFEGCTERHKKIYSMIYKRTVASQMAAAVYKEFHYEMKNVHTFKTSSSALVFDGFLILDGAKIDNLDAFLVKDGDSIRLKELRCIPCVTTAKSLYTDGELIREMERMGVGRPSTYATTVSILYDRGYVEKGENPCKEIETIEYHLKGPNEEPQSRKLVLKTASSAKNLIRPTGIGIDVYKFLLDKCDFITNHEFTKIMEDNLDKIATKAITKNVVLNSFYEKLNRVVSLNPRTDNNDTSQQIKIINTRYGRCIYVPVDKRYINIDAILKWKKADTLQQNEIEFLVRLPIRYNDVYHLHNGRYGLYLKDREGNNKALDISKWQECFTM